MAEMYPQEDFGPVEINITSTDGMTKSDLLTYKRNIEKLEKLKKDGYMRIKNKIKELRRGYKKAIDSRTRSGSGRMVQEHFDVLKEIWSGSPAVISLNTNLSSMQPECDEQTSSESSIQIKSNEPGENDSDDVERNETEFSESACNSRKRKNGPVKENKREKLQKQLSAHQRDMLYIDIAREELQLKKEQLNMLQKSFE